MGSMIKEKEIITKLLTRIAQSYDWHDNRKNDEYLIKSKDTILALVRHFDDSDGISSYNRAMIKSTMYINDIFIDAIRPIDPYKIEQTNIAHKMYDIMNILLDELADESLWNTPMTYREYKMYICALMETLYIQQPEILVALKNGYVRIEKHYKYDKKTDEEVIDKEYYDIIWYNGSSLCFDGERNRIDRIHYKDMMLVSLALKIFTYPHPDSITDIFEPDEINYMHKSLLEYTSKYDKRTSSLVKQETEYIKGIS